MNVSYFEKSLDMCHLADTQGVPGSFVETPAMVDNVVVTSDSQP